MPRLPAEHTRTNNAKRHHRPQDDRQAKRTFNTGSKTWRAIRARILMRDSYTCRECGKYGNQVDHIGGDASLNDDDDLQTLCHAHHSAKTVKENHGFGNTIHP